jgi:hypothetical protein
MTATSLLGGTYHGFVQSAALWKSAIVLAGATNMFMLWSISVATFRAPIRTGLVAFAIIKFIVFAFWIVGHDSFKFVVYDSLSAMVPVLIFQCLELFCRKVPSIGWIVGGVLVSMFAALVQRTNLSFAGLLNHNDIYHVIQMVGLWLLYRGGRLLQDRA